MTQTAALFLDAYRELNAKKLFWITLILSGIVVASMACLGVNEQGISILVWTLPFQNFNSTTLPPELFYKGVFTNIGVSLWLSIFATILALVSTAGIVPDLITGGSIDAVLSKPIGRARLFLTKYLTGLLFVTLQVTIFCVAAFLLIGVRGGAWEPAIFIAIPLVVAFFSYLFSICVLIGLVTRSTITALLLTMLAWGGLFALHSAETMVFLARVGSEQEVELIGADIERREADLARFEQIMSAGGESAARVEPRLGAKRTALDKRRGQLIESEDSLRTWTFAHKAMMAAKTVLPKTSETIGLLERTLVDLAELPEPPKQPSRFDAMTDYASEIDVNMLDPSVAIEAAERTRERSVAWIVGTSLGFEAVLLAIATLIFMRRDF